MRKKILGFVFAAAVLMAMAVPLFGGVGTASAHNLGHVHTGAGTCVEVGGGNFPPEGNGNGPGGLAGIHHAAAQGNSRVVGGHSC